MPRILRGDDGGDGDFVEPAVVDHLGDGAHVHAIDIAKQGATVLDVRGQALVLQLATDPVGAGAAVDIFDVDQCLLRPCPGQGDDFAHLVIEVRLLIHHANQAAFRLEQQGIAQVVLRQVVEITALGDFGRAFEPIVAAFVAHHRDAMVEGADARRLVDQVLATARIDKGRPGLEPHPGQHGGNGLGDVLAVADAVFVDVAERSRHETALPERKGEIADTALDPAHRGDNAVLGVGVLGLDLADFIQQAGRHVLVAFETRAHQVGDLFPRFQARCVKAARRHDPARHIALDGAWINTLLIESDLAVAIGQGLDLGLSPPGRERLDEYLALGWRQDTDVAAVPEQSVLQRHGHRELALEAGRVARQGDGGVDDIADADIRNGHRQGPAAVQHQALEGAFAAHDQVALFDVDLDHLIAAQYADVVDGQFVIIGIERQSEVGEIVERRQVDHFLDRAVIAVRLVAVEARLVVHQPGVEAVRGTGLVEPGRPLEGQLNNPGRRRRETDASSDLFLEHRPPPSCVNP